MAFLNQDDEDQSQGLNNPQDQNQQQQEQVPLSSGSQSVGGSSVPTTNQPQQAQPNPKASSGSFTNIRQYIDANKGNRISSSTSQKLQSVTGQAQRGISNAQNQFQQKVETGTLANRGQALQDIQSAVQKAKTVTAQPLVQPAPVVAPAPTTTAPQSAPSPEVAPVAATPVEAPKPVAPNYIDEETKKRFSDIVNAKYQGPQSLRQAGVFDKASTTVKNAQELLDKTKTAQSRTDLLRDMFAKNRDYTRGQQGLDALLLNTDKAGVAQLQQQGKESGNLQKTLETADTTSQNIATNRANEIAGIQNQARQSFTGSQEEVNSQIEDRLSSVVKDWDKLPEYFRETIRNKEKNNIAQRDLELNALPKIDPQLQQTYAGLKARADDNEGKLANAKKGLGVLTQMINDNPNAADTRQLQQQLNVFQNEVNSRTAQKQDIETNPAFVDYLTQKADIDAKTAEINNNFNPNILNLSAEEAAIMGVGVGEGLYNVGEDLIKTTQADKERLVSRDEQARQYALAQLAGLDTSKLLNTNVKYSDLAKAGTQTATDALDVQAIRNRLNEEQELFKNSAIADEIVGRGSKKVSRGNAFGKKTSTYDAIQSANVADMLAQAGYDVRNMEQGKSQSLLNNKDLLNKYVGAVSGDGAQTNNIGGSTLEGAGAGAATGASIGSFGGPKGAAIGASIGTALGSILGSNSTDAVQISQDLLNDFENKLGIKGASAVSKGISDARGLVASPITGIGNSVGGTLGSAISSIGSAVRGIDTGAMKEYGSSLAKEFALEDLRRKYSQYLEDKGFQNRTNLVDNQTVNSRTEGLRQILANLDKTNA